MSSRVLLATQCIEPEMLLLLEPDIQCLICIGDPKQLPPTLQCESLREKGLSNSMFERLVNRGNPGWLLNTQYRLDPAISLWPNTAFYAGQLLDGANVTSNDRNPAWLGSEFTEPLAFL